MEKSNMLDLCDYPNTECCFCPYADCCDGEPIDQLIEI